MRVRDWEDRLAQTIIAWNDTAFEWGEADCVCSSAACIQATTGHDPMEHFRGRYDSEETALEFIAVNGHRSLYHFLIAEFGPSLKATFAQRGDLVYRKASLDAGAVGICIGGEAVFKAEKGWTAIPLKQCARAWRIG